MVMIVASLSPLALANSTIDEDIAEFSYGNLDGFEPSIEGKKYMLFLIHISEPTRPY